MRYKIDKFEEQQVDTFLADPNFSGVNVRTHAGEVSPQTFMNDGLREGFARLLPALFVQYQSRTLATSDSTKQENLHVLSFRYYICAKSLRSKREAQISAYALLRSVYDRIHGRYPAAATFPVYTGAPILTGFTVEAATNATPIVLKVTGHRWETGDKVYIKKGIGNTAVNNTSINPDWTVTKVDADHLSLDGSVGNGSYTANSADVIQSMESSTLHVMSPFKQLERDDERLVVNLPGMAVYSSDYSINVIA